MPKPPPPSSFSWLVNIIGPGAYVQFEQDTGLEITINGANLGVCANSNSSYIGAPWFINTNSSEPGMLLVSYPQNSYSEYIVGAGWLTLGGDVYDWAVNTGSNALDLSISASKIQGNSVVTGVPYESGYIMYWTGSTWAHDWMDYHFMLTYPIVAGVFSTASSSPVRMGQITIDPTVINPPTGYTLSNPTLFVDFETTAGTATAQLYNATDSVNVGSAVTTTSSTNNEQSTTLTIGVASGDLISTGPKSYQLLVSVSGGGTATITNSRIVFDSFFAVVSD